MGTKKRSQVTLFIIIGIVLLFLVLGILYMRAILEPDGPILAEKDPVKLYVEQCLGIVSEEALGYIGMQAGYVDTEGADTVSALYDPSNSDILALAGGKLYLP